MRKIIGISGFIGSGKGTVGDILTDHYGFKKISYADRVKDTLSTIFGWDRVLLEGDTPAARSWRETPDPFWTDELGYEMTPRLAMQRIGTDCMRAGFDDNIWVLILKKTLLDNPDTNYVVPDVRFFNERDLLIEQGGEIWQVRRGKQPPWINEAISDNLYDTNWMTVYPEIHESEWRWLDHDSTFNYIINNDSTQEHLEDLVKKRLI